MFICCTQLAHILLLQSYSRVLYRKYPGSLFYFYVGLLFSIVQKFAQLSFCVFVFHTCVSALMIGPVRQVPWYKLNCKDDSNLSSDWAKSDVFRVSEARRKRLRVTLHASSYMRLILERIHSPQSQYTQKTSSRKRSQNSVRCSRCAAAILSSGTSRTERKSIREDSLQCGPLSKQRVAGKQPTRAAAVVEWVRLFSSSKCEEGPKRRRGPTQTGSLAKKTRVDRAEQAGPSEGDTRSDR